MTEETLPAVAGPVERGVGRPVPELADVAVLAAQVDSLRAALVNVLDARDKEAKANASYRVARDNFSAGGRMDASDHLLVLSQLASTAEREARLLLATLKTPNARVQPP